MMDALIEPVQNQKLEGSISTTTLNILKLIGILFMLTLNTGVNLISKILIKWCAVSGFSRGNSRYCFDICVRPVLGMVGDLGDAILKSL